MSTTFTKLFSSITESTIWKESHTTRLVWITMLAMADRKGRIWASVPGLADRARVTNDECLEALTTFLSPDPWSRSKEEDGKRIRIIDGGWQLVNHEKYKKLRDEDSIRESKRIWAEKNRNNRTPSNAVGSNSANAEAESDPDPEEKEIQKKKSFEPPTIDGVKAIFAELGSTETEALKFFHFYESKGWMVGKTKMRRIRSAASGWVLRCGHTTHDIKVAEKAVSGPAKAPSTWELTKKIETFQKLMQQLKNHHTYEDAFGDHWNNQDARAKYREMEQKISELQKQLVNGQPADTTPSLL